MTQYVISRLVNSVSYCFWNDPVSTNGLPFLREKITISGGAGLPSIKSGFGDLSADGNGIPLWTADGTVNAVSDSQYEKLKDHTIFKRHVENGLIRVVTKDVSGNHKEVKKITSGMEKDGFAQLTPSTYSGKVKPISGNVDGNDNRI